jgi:hypothetical protein
MAREISRSGARAATGDLRRLMAELQARHPGDRENSLYASVELSLRRLPAELREKLSALSMFHGGADLAVVGWILDQDFEAAIRLAVALIEVGLAEMLGYGHLRLDPALPNYLLGQMSAAEQERTRSLWAEGMRELTGLLDEQRSQDAQAAAQQTMLELPNLLALLDWAQDALTPEEVVDLAGWLESVFRLLGRPKARAQAAKANLINPDFSRWYSRLFSRARRPTRNKPSLNFRTEISRPGSKRYLPNSKPSCAAPATRRSRLIRFWIIAMPWNCNCCWKRWRRNQRNNAMARTERYANILPHVLRKETEVQPSVQPLLKIVLPCGGKTIAAWAGSRRLSDDQSVFHVRITVQRDVDGAATGDV